MTVRTTDTIPEYYDEGCLPWRYGVGYEDSEVPVRLPIELMQSPTIKQLMIVISLHFGPRMATTFVDTNVPIRYDPNNLRVFIAPDICVSFDVDMFAIRYKDSYDLWEIGKSPEFVLEVASPSTYRRDLYEKPDIYAFLGVNEYWLFDPRGGDLYGHALAGYRLVDGKYEPIEVAQNEHGIESGFSETLGLRLCSVEYSRQSELVAVQQDFVFMVDDFNPAQLLLQDPDTGLYLLNAESMYERRERAEVERAQAEERAERAESELEAAQAEIARLRARSGQSEQD